MLYKYQPRPKEQSAQIPLTSYYTKSSCISTICACGCILTILDLIYVMSTMVYALVTTPVSRTMTYIAISLDAFCMFNSIVLLISCLSSIWSIYEKWKMYLIFGYIIMISLDVYGIVNSLIAIAETTNEENKKELLITLVWYIAVMLFTLLAFISSFFMFTLHNDLRYIPYICNSLNHPVNLPTLSNYTTI